MFDGTNLVGVDEASAPEPAALLDYYTTTKRDAERLVLKARACEREGEGGPTPRHERLREDQEGPLLMGATPWPD